jgi:uncharacterized membrane protein
METIKETIEWRLIAVFITFLITYLWTGKLIEATGLTLALNLTKTLAFYLWRKIKKGHLRGYFNKLKLKS